MTTADTGASALAASRRVSAVRWRDSAPDSYERVVPEEAPIALVHDASTTAVMMATPADIEDFAVGFSLSERVIGSLADIRSLEVASDGLGVEARIWLTADRSAALTARRRSLVGPTGCGLCGVESLAQALPSLPRVAAGGRISPEEVLQAVEALSSAQALGAATRTVHAAGFWTPGQRAMPVREDVGRHNALDKLVGALARLGTDAATGAVVLTSRISVEMVQKTARLGAPILIAVSAPTALAVRTAQACGVTLVAVARRDGFEVFAGAERIVR